MFGKKENPDLEYFIIQDTKVGVPFREPVLAINRFDILRQIESLFSKPGEETNPLVQNSEDFQLFKIGEYNKRTGVITPCHHEHIANLFELKTAAQHRAAKPVGMTPT